MASLTEFLSALRGAPASIQSIDAQLSKLYAERDLLRKAPPALADVTAWAIRGLDNASADALRRLKDWHFNAESLATWSGEIFDSHSGPNILALTQTKPHSAVAGSNVSMPAPAGDAPDMCMLLHVLRPAIEPQLRALVEECFGDACKGGMPSSERNTKLAKVGEKIAALEAQRKVVQQAVQEAVRHLDAAQHAANQASPGEQYDGGPILNLHAE